MTGSNMVDAQQAFTRAARARRRAALVRILRREPAACRQLRVYDERKLRPAEQPGGRIREIPIDAIRGTVEPARASRFDDRFRPAPVARSRWERLWLAEHRGKVLPPISVVRVADGYAVRDGHHRVSVARARGALSIDASVDAPSS